MDRIPDDDQHFFLMLDAFAEALGALEESSSGRQETFKQVPT